MYLTPIIRTNRAIAACLIAPNDPLQAIALSETLSVVMPLFNPKLLPKILGIIIAIMYNPYYANYYISSYHKINNIHNEAEICSLLLFILTLGVQYI